MPSHLTNSQKKFIRRLAHGAPASMQLGKFGLTPNFYKSFETALFSHEVLKLRFTNLQDERKELSAEIETQTGATLVSMVGHTAVFYRPCPDPDKRKIVLPRPGRGTSSDNLDAYLT
jgi:RNA-binding protein